MKHIGRLFSFVLCLTLLIPAAIACAETSDPVETTDASTVAPVVDESTALDTSNLYDEQGFLKSDLPELDFNGDTVVVLYWSDVEMQEYEAEEINSVLVNDAIYKRNEAVQKTLNVKFDWLSTKGNGSNINNFVTHVGNIYKAGDTQVDLISSYSRTTALCAMEGYCTDLNELPYINFDMPWWPASLLDVVSIGDSVYFASGDASVNVLHFMYAIYYNKDLISEYKLENPVDLVRSREWTLEKLISMTKDTYQDLNSDSTENIDDFFGFVGASYGLDAFYTGSGLRLVDQDEDKLLVVSPDFFSNKAIDLCDTLGSWNATTDCFINGSHEDPFVAGNAIFNQNRCYLADRKLAGQVDFSYGIVPTPLYNKDQEDYISVVGNPFSLYAIFTSSPNAERAAAVLECWASEAYRTTTPAQFEMNMKLRYSETSDESDMYNIIRTTVCFDLGRLFNTELNDITDIFFRAAVNNQNWSSLIGSNKIVLPKRMQVIANAFTELQEN